MAITTPLARGVTDEASDFIDLNTVSGDVADGLVLIGGASGAHFRQQAENGSFVPFATPVMREVERIEQPSTSAETTATRFSMLNLFMLQV